VLLIDNSLGGFADNMLRKPVFMFYLAVETLMIIQNKTIKHTAI